MHVFLIWRYPFKLHSDQHMALWYSGKHAGLLISRLWVQTPQNLTFSYLHLRKTCISPLITVKCTGNFSAGTFNCNLMVNFSGNGHDDF